MTRVGIQSRQLHALPHLSRFFPEWDIRRLSWVWPDTNGLDALVGWGHKRYGLRTRRLAAHKQLPYIALEDGFVRSYDLAVRGAQPWSLVCDSQGIYYDATQPSQLEALIAACNERPEAAALLTRMRAEKISKYNTGSLAPLPLESPYVLLIDQCRGDASVPLGYADADSFTRMIAAARARHPGLPLVVKTHPDVLSGAREGYIDRSMLPAHAQMIGAEVNPYLLFEGAVEVHVVTSLLGMEALLTGKKVLCHAAPFYAGWGLTEDSALPDAVAARRRARPTLTQIFSAAYLDYCRYIDPWSGEPSTLERTIDQILWLRRQYAMRPVRLHAVGFSHWKQPHVTPFLIPPGGTIVFHNDVQSAIHVAAHDEVPLAVWAAKETNQLAKDCAAAKVKLLRVEDGFVRSAGLGSDLIPASSLVVDGQGIYFDAGAASELETMLETENFEEALLQRAKTLRERIVAAQLSKYNLGGEALPAFPPGKSLVLVVGQVEDDASIRRGAADVRSNAALLAAVRQARPDAWIIYKPHPDVVAGNRKAGLADTTPERYADQVVTHGNLPDLLGRVDELHTITSLAGFEMLLRGGKVVTYGWPFYAGWGLTEDKAGMHPRRQRPLTIDMLVAGALIRYPAYYDWHARLPATPEHTVESLANGARGYVAQTGWIRQIRRLRRWLT